MDISDLFGGRLFQLKVFYNATVQYAAACFVYHRTLLKCVLE